MKNRQKHRYVSDQLNFMANMVFPRVKFDKIASRLILEAEFTVAMNDISTLHSFAHQRISFLDTLKKGVDLRVGL